MKILSLMFAMFVLVSLATAVSATMPKYDPDVASAMATDMPITTPGVYSIMVPEDPTFNVVFMSEGSNTMSNNLGWFQVVGTNFGSFTGTKQLSPGVYTIKFIPKAGFTFDRFMLSGNVQIYSQYQQSGPVPESIDIGQGPDIDMIASNGMQYPSITVQITGNAMIKAYAYDVQAPTVAIHSSTVSQVTAGNTFTVYATANDNDVMYPVRLTLTINGNVYNMDKDPNTGLYSYAVTGLSAGTYSYTVEARDAARNSNTASGSVVVNQPVTPPNNGGNNGGNTGGSSGGSYSGGSTTPVKTVVKTSTPVVTTPKVVAPTEPAETVVYAAEPVAKVSFWKSTVAKLIGLNLILLIILLIIIFGMR